MKKGVLLGVFMAGVLLFGSCGGNNNQQYADDDDSTAVDNLTSRDRTVYGICTGGLAPSDRLAVVPDSAGHVALQVINLNALMGDWVMPDPIDGSAEVGIRIKEGGIAESIEQSVIIYRTWKIVNGELEILLVREGGGDEQETNRYELLMLGPDTLAYRTLGKPRDETETFEYNRWKEKPKVDLHGLELEDTGDEFNKI